MMTWRMLSTSPWASRWPRLPATVRPALQGLSAGVGWQRRGHWDWPQQARSGTELAWAWPRGVIKVQASARSERLALGCMCPDWLSTSNLAGCRHGHGLCQCHHRGGDSGGRPGRSAEAGGRRQDRHDRQLAGRLPCLLFVLSRLGGAKASWDTAWTKGALASLSQSPQQPGARAARFLTELRLARARLPCLQPTRRLLEDGSFVDANLTDAEANATWADEGEFGSVGSFSIDLDDGNYTAAADGNYTAEADDGEDGWVGSSSIDLGDGNYTSVDEGEDAAAPSPAPVVAPSLSTAPVEQPSAPSPQPQAPAQSVSRGLLQGALAPFFSCGYKAVS